MKKLAVISGTLSVLLGVGVWFGGPFHSGRQQEKLLAETAALIAQKEFGRAIVTARQVLEKNSRNLPAILAIAEAFELQDSPDALIWRQRAVELAPTLTNRAALVSAALRLEDPPYVVAAKTLEDFDAAAKEATAYHRLAGELAFKLKNWETAELHFRDALVREPQNEHFQLKLALVRLHSLAPVIVNEARQTLEQLSRHPRLGAEALRALVAHYLEAGDLAAAESCSRRLLNAHLFLYSDQLEHLGILHRQKSPQFNASLQSLQNAATRNPDEIYQLGRWMSGAGLADEGLLWIQTLPFALQLQQPVPKAVAACYAAQNDWGRLETFLREQRWGDDDFIRVALISQALFIQGEKKLAHFNWQKAVQLAAGRMDWMFELSGMAQSWGWEVEAEDLLWTIASSFPNDRAALRVLYRYYLASDNTLGLYKVHTALVQLDSSEASLKSKVASLSFLLNTEISKAQELAREVFTQDPRNFGFVSTYAYSLHLQGKTSEALKLMSALPPLELEVPEVAAYYGILLAAAGDSERARKYLAMAERAQILPEDKKMLLQARRVL